MAEPGLDQPVPMGAFLNGVFPKTAPGPSGTWALKDAFPQLTFVDPVRMVNDPQNSEYVYVVCRNGEIWRVLFSEKATTDDRLRVLDLKECTLGFGDAGMMSMAFHPDFGMPGNPNRNYVYVFYQYTPERPKDTDPATPGYLRLSRFTIPDGEVALDPKSEFVLIQQFDRHSWHGGGGMFFGPDRFLYLAIGDEGGSNDFYHSGQKIDDRLFAGILRIDVDQDLSRSQPVKRRPAKLPVPEGWPESFTQGYTLPKDNPWLDQKGGVLGEFWSIGTRNPHSMYHDDETGEIYVADVGQDAREEITLAIRGGNHQWPFKEGSIAGPKAKPKKRIGKEVSPVFDYARSMGGCVIGGMVYRGSQHAAALTGKYIFGDHSSRGIYALDRADEASPEAEFLVSIPRVVGSQRGLSGISEGPDGEPYFIELGDAGTDTGKIYKLVRTGTLVADPPRWLSQAGAFEDLKSLKPVAGLLKYEVNSPLWSDGAEKHRWIAVPNDGAHDAAEEQVTFRDRGEWDFPIGTVLVKHFALALDARDPSRQQPIETRFFVRGSDGIYYGVTYRWNDEGTDAELLSKRENRKLKVTESNGKARSQIWTFPSRSDCFTCHSTDAGSVLGLRSHQMAKDVIYDLTGRTADQLETWNHLGMFGDSFGKRDPKSLPRAVDPHDENQSLDLRVKSYLEANCAHCHHPGGVAANFDASFHVPLSSQKLVKGMINRPMKDLADRVVVPGDLSRSVMHGRVAATGAKQMPPLGRNVVDPKGVKLIADWIRSLNEESFPASSQPGLQADYYAGRNFEELVFSRTDATIDFDWGMNSPGEGLPDDGFSVRWHGEIRAPVSGSYTFFATSDDGLRVTVNRVKVIDSWMDQEATERSGPILLTAGKEADVMVEGYDGTGSAMAKLEWEGPGISRQVVPESVLWRSSVTDQEPVAEDDEVAVKRGAEVKIDVLENDVGLNAALGIHGVAIVGTPNHGRVKIDAASHRLIYQQDGSDFEADEFQYTVTDTRGRRSRTATVRIILSP